MMHDTDNGGGGGWIVWGTTKHTSLLPSHSKNLKFTVPLRKIITVKFRVLKNMPHKTSEGQNTLEKVSGIHYKCPEIDISWTMN
jgi:hypothetical protein